MVSMSPYPSMVNSFNRGAPVAGTMLSAQRKYSKFGEKYKVLNKGFPNFGCYLHNFCHV
jgi:hypothetical protein